MGEGRGCRTHGHTEVTAQPPCPFWAWENDRAHTWGGRFCQPGRENDSEPTHHAVGSNPHVSCLFCVLDTQKFCTEITIKKTKNKTFSHFSLPEFTQNCWQSGCVQFLLNKTLFLDRSTAVNAANEIPLTCRVFGRLQKAQNVCK